MPKTEPADRLRRGRSAPVRAQTRWPLERGLPRLEPHPWLTLDPEANRGRGADGAVGRSRRGGERVGGRLQRSVIQTAAEVESVGTHRVVVGELAVSVAPSPHAASVCPCALTTTAGDTSVLEPLVLATGIGLV